MWKHCWISRCSEGHGLLIARFTSLLSVLSISLLSGCGGEEVRVPQTLWEDPGGSVRRTIIPVEWNRVWRRGSLEDTLLISPLRLQGHDEGVYVLDTQASRVLAFDLEGDLQWTFGAPGQGPGEFTSARDLRLSSDEERIYVHDPENARITILDPTGEVIRLIPIRGAGASETLVPLNDSLFLVVTGAEEEPLVVLDMEGEARARMSLPWSGFASLPRLSRQGTAATDGNQWVYGFILGNGFFPFEGLDSLGYVGRYIEHTEFPEVTVTRTATTTTSRLAVRPVCSGCSLSLSHGILYALFGGHGPNARRIIDMYAWRSGEYLGTYQLPAQATWIHVHDDRLYVLANVPYPLLVSMELPEPPELPGRPGSPERPAL